MKKHKLNYWDIFNYLLYAMVVIFALLAISSKFSLGGIKLLTVKSGSMEPTIKTGSMVIVKSFYYYQVGDIVTFKNLDNSLETTTHRIVKSEVIEGQPVFTTQGDANNIPDLTKLTPDRIVGKIKFKLPFFGYAVAFARTWPGVIILIVVPATIIIYDEINNLKKEWALRKKPKKKVI